MIFCIFSWVCTRLSTKYISTILFQNLPSNFYRFVVAQDHYTCFTFRLSNPKEIKNLRLASVWSEQEWWMQQFITLPKSQTSVTNATIHPIGQAIWGHIWRHTVEKSQTNATSVIMHPLIQALWGHIWKRTVEKGKQMQPMWFCVLL